MSIYTGVDARVLSAIGADVMQLTRPIHLAVRGRILTHPPLLDQLRAATQPGTTNSRPERRQVPTSHPPVDLAAVDLLATVYGELCGWHTRHRLPQPPAGMDWHKAALRQLVGLAPTLAGEVADWLAADVHSWWHDAAMCVGWRPAELMRVR
jgi:hypothetical protein